MTADVRLAIAPLLATPIGRNGAAQRQERLFPSRLVMRQPPARASHSAPGDLATRTWLLARLWFQHASLERRIVEEAARPRPDAAELGALKRARVAVRDRIAVIERSL